MNKRTAAIGLTVLILAIGVTTASAGGVIRDLSADAVNSTSIEAVWNCTDKDDPLFILTYRVVGQERAVRLNTHGEYYLFSSLCPDTAYEITVSTESGGTQTAIVTTDASPDHVGYNYQLLETGVYQSASGEEDYTAVTSLGGAALAGELDTTDYSLRFTFKITAAETDRTLDFVLALRLPNGDIYTASDTFWYTQRSQTVTQPYVFNDLLEEIADDYGAFPAGTYTLTAYLNGSFAAETAFAIE
jgi:hypothetical protein